MLWKWFSLSAERYDQADVLKKSNKGYHHPITYHPFCSPTTAHPESSIAPNSPSVMPSDGPSKVPSSRPTNQTEHPYIFPSVKPSMRPSCNHYDKASTILFQASSNSPSIVTASPTTASSVKSPSTLPSSRPSEHPLLLLFSHV